MTDTTKTTAWDALFAGRQRKFELRIGEIGELERLCEAGVGEIALRLATHRFTHADIRETVRLGLLGGGTGQAESTALTIRYVDGHPLSEHLTLAIDIIGALLNGAAAHAKKKATEESASDPLAISPAGTMQAA